MQDEHFLRIAIEVARQSRQAGNHPFGAILVDAQSNVVMQAGNGHLTGDRTAHAERLLMTQASLAYPVETLRQCTMFVSAEPCAMCAGSAYWAGIGRIVYALSETRLRAMIGPHPENLTMDLPCRTVFAAGQRAVTVTGPLLEDEAAAVHTGFWTRPAQ